MGKLNRTYNDSLSFVPSRDLLLQILKVEDNQSSEEYTNWSRELMVQRILEC